MIISEERFEAAMFAIAREAGTDVLLTIPGVWEVVSEYFGNDAIDRIQLGEKDELPERLPRCRYCGGGES